MILITQTQKSGHITEPVISGNHAPLSPAL